MSEREREKDTNNAFTKSRTRIMEKRRRRQSPIVSETDGNNCDGQTWRLMVMMLFPYQVSKVSSIIIITAFDVLVRIGSQDSTTDDH